MSKRLLDLKKTIIDSQYLKSLKLTFLLVRRDIGAKEKKNLTMMDLLWNLLNDNEKSRISKKKKEVVEIKAQKVSEKIK